MTENIGVLVWYVIIICTSSELHNNHLSKVYYKNIKGFIFGKNSKKFSSNLKNKIKFKKFSNLKEALKGVFKDIKKDDSIKKTILFSPAAASFDSFINFEDRGSYFNKLIKRYINDR